MTETTAPPPAPPALTLVCPHCGNPDLRIFYSERRACRVTTRALATADPTAFQGADPWPSYQADEFVDIDPDTFAVWTDIEGGGSGYILARYAPGPVEWDTGGGDPVRLGGDETETYADELAALAAAITGNTHDLVGARQRPDDYRYDGTMP